MASKDDGLSTGRGACRCGGVRYGVTGDLRGVVYCHCEDCRRITGHHMAATSAAITDVNFESDDTLTWYSAQLGVSYGFCNRCGATLFWKADDKPDRLSICAGTLDQPTGLRTEGVLFGDETADYIAERPDVPIAPGDRQTS